MRASCSSSTASCSGAPTSPSDSSSSSSRRKASDFLKSGTPSEPSHDQPGTPARVQTFAHRDDLADLVEDVRREKQGGRFVIVSVHWGIHFIPAVIADYQRDVAHAAIDAGADAVVGHHAHILKGVEI